MLKQYHTGLVSQRGGVDSTKENLIYCRQESGYQAGPIGHVTFFLKLAQCHDILTMKSMRMFSQIKKFTLVPL